MRWLLGVALAFLLACAPVQPAEAPVEPAAEPAVSVEDVPAEPAKEEIKILEDIEEIPEAPEQIIEPAAVPAELNCMDECDQRCELDARAACSENFNRDCKAKCGTIIEPITCATACSFDKRNCIPFFEDACKNKCVQVCN